MRRPLFWIGILILLIIAVVYSFGFLPESFVAEVKISEVTNFRENICDLILRKFPKSSAGIICAILIGDNSYLNAETIRAFRLCGMSHILVVSGMHLAISAGFVNLFLKKANGIIKLIIVLSFVWAYALLTGFGLSSIRAAIMISISQVAVLFKRRGDTLTSLAIAGIIIAVLSPGSIKTASFLLSFSAVIGIAVFGKKLPISLSAQIGTLPVIVFLFGYIPLWGFIANVIAVPLLFPLLILGILWAIFPGLIPVLTPIISFVTNVITVIAKVFSSLPFASIGMGENWQKMIILIIYVFVAYVIIFKPSKTFVTDTAVILTSVFLLMNIFVLAFLHDTVSITSFRKKGVTVFMLGTHAIVYNIPRDSYDVYKLTNYLHSENIYTIDYVFTDADIFPNELYSFVLQNNVKAINGKNTKLNKEMAEEWGIPLYSSSYSLKDVYDIMKDNGYRIRTKIKSDY